MTQYLENVIRQMRQAKYLMSDPNYIIDVYCTLLYSVQDYQTLVSDGEITPTFSMQQMAEKYFSKVISDLGAEFGDDIILFNFVVQSAIGDANSMSEIFIFVDVTGAYNKKKSDMQEYAKNIAFGNKRGQYAEDLASSNSKYNF